MARTGRPREFDREQALDAAMMLFWAQGYEPTSLNQLKEVMGSISPASFYAAFGSKEALFREVVGRYAETFGTVTDSLRDESLPPREAIETALRRSVQMQSGTSHPPGCLIVLGASNCADDNRHIAGIVQERRALDRDGIRACLARAIAVGDLAATTDAEALTEVFACFLMGIATEVRDGADPKRLNAAIAALMRLWDMNAPTRA